MYLSQQLEQQSDPRYRRDWRVVTYRVVWTDDHKKLKWVRHGQGKWRGTLRRRVPGSATANVYPAKERASRDFQPGIAIINAVRAHKPVTAAEAAKLTGMAGFAAMDFLMERDLDHPDVVKVPAKLKPVADKAAVRDQKLRKAAGKVKELTTRIKRLTTALKKWQRRQRLYEREAKVPE